MTLLESQIINLPKIADPRGNLSIIEQFKQIPFEIKRTYWIYDVPGGCDRGGHAYKENQEFIVALSGAFDVVLDDGKEKKTFLLNHPWEGLLIYPGIWRTLEYFSSGAVCLVLASELFDEADYIRDYDDFLAYCNDNSHD